MKEFLLLFRNELNAIPKDSPVEMKALAKKWQDWLGGIAAQNKLVAAGKRMYDAGKVVRNSGVTDGPYIEIKEMLAGQCSIRAESIDDAIEIAKGCPILITGGNVEIRELY
ncbi:MAG: YciI family protein [Ignavibacteriaceae bacterium]